MDSIQITSQGIIQDLLKITLLFAGIISLMILPRRENKVDLKYKPLHQECQLAKLPHGYLAMQAQPGILHGYENQIFSSKELKR